MREESSDDETRGESSSLRGPTTRAIRIAFAVGLVVGIVATPVLAAYLSNSVPVDNGVPVGASQGPTVVLEGSGDVNLTDFADGQTLELTTSGGNMTLYSNGNTEAAADFSDLTGSETILRNVDASTELYINPEDKPGVNVTGSADLLAFTNMEVNDGETDLQYDASSAITVTIRTDAEDGTRFKAVDTSTGERLDTDTSDGGELTYTLESGARTVAITNIEVGDVTGYYENASTLVENESYYDGRENATIDNVANMFTRLGTYVVGTSDAETSLSGGATLIFGLIVWGAILVMSGWTRTGMVGGGVLGTTAVAGLVSVGLAPAWLWGVVLLVLGGLLAGPVLRLLE